MLRTTAGNWLNYATTLIAQVLFAKHYGSTGAATAYTVTFGLMTAALGVLVSCVQSVVLPRLLTADGSFARSALRFMALLTGAAAAVALATFLAADGCGHLLAGHTAIDAGLFADLLRIAAVSLLLQFVAGELVAIALVRGRRLLPGLAPGFPSTAVALALLVSASLDVRGAFIFFAVGSMVELGVLLFGLGGSIRLADSPVDKIGLITAASLLQYGFLAMLAPFERIVIAGYQPRDAARYDYAMRTLASVQSLIVGGMALAGLGTWSALAARGELERLRAAVARTTLLAGVVLVLAASVALVSIHSLVAFVYQHGRFSSADSAAVSMLVLLALTGFVAAGAGAMLSTALVATRHNRWLITIGMVHVGVRVVLVLVFARLWGANGVAAAYSLALATSLCLQLIAVSRASLWPRRRVLSIVRVAIPGLGTLGAALVLLALGGSVPGLLRGCLVAVTFAVLLAAARPQLIPRLSTR